MFMVVHFEIEEAAEIFKGFAIFNNWQIIMIILILIFIAARTRNGVISAISCA